MRLLSFFLSFFILPLFVIAQADMEKAALEAKKLGEKKLADSLARVYKTNYLDKLNDTLFFTRKNLQFMSNFPGLIRSEDRVFKFYYYHSETADLLVGNGTGYANYVVKYVIRREEVDALLYRDDKMVKIKPNWKRMYRNIKNKYNFEYADEIVQNAKQDFYRKIGNWKEFAHVFDKRIKQNRPTRTSNSLGGNYGDPWTMNAFAWDVFLNCNDKTVLEKALNWVNLGITFCDTEAGTVQYLDTKANILYKLGNDRSAIQYEEKVVSLSNKNKDYLSTLSKMQQGSPTWPLK